MVSVILFHMIDSLDGFFVFDGVFLMMFFLTAVCYRNQINGRNLFVCDGLVKLKSAIFGEYFSPSQVVGYQ